MVITLKASSAFFLILTLEGKRVRSNNPAFDCRISRSTFLPSRERMGRLAALFVAALRFFLECRQITISLALFELVGSLFSAAVMRWHNFVAAISTVVGSLGHRS
jgi:hypothetical protein